MGRFHNKQYPADPRPIPVRDTCRGRSQFHPSIFNKVLVSTIKYNIQKKHDIIISLRNYKEVNPTSDPYIIRIQVDIGFRSAQKTLANLL